MTITGIILLVLAAFMVVPFIFLFRWLSHHYSKRAVIGIAAAIWIAGGIIAQVPVIELRFVGGICTLSGFIGVILGILGVFQGGFGRLPSRYDGRKERSQPNTVPSRDAEIEAYLREKERRKTLK
jgi:hypothetical protein